VRSPRDIAFGGIALLRVSLESDVTAVVKPRFNVDVLGSSAAHGDYICSNFREEKRLEKTIGTEKYRN
jgi:hypothetical protein